METAQSLKDRAVEKTRLSDFGDDHSDDPLHAWAEDLANPRLNEVGRAVFLNQMVGDLSRRLRVIDCLKRNPAIDKVAVPPILCISGLERTGTTLLHNLLSLHPKARALLRWQLMHPTPPPEAATYASDPRIAKAQASIDKLRGTLLESMHWVNANDPEECQWGMIDGSSIMGRSAVVSMPTWREWAARRDPIAGLREYRRVVKLLLWRNPPPAGGHLVLKCPQFLGDLGTLASVFPEARFVVTHRDPFRAIVSVCALQASIHEPYFADASVLRKTSLVPDVFVPFAESRLRKLFEFCDGRSVIHVAYPELVRDPASAVRAIYRDECIPAPHGARDQIDAFIRGQKEGKRAEPPAALPTFGIDHIAFLSRETFAEYCRKFHIAPERIRQTGA